MLARFSGDPANHNVKYGILELRGFRNFRKSKFQKNPFFWGLQYEGRAELGNRSQTWRGERVPRLAWDARKTPEFGIALVSGAGQYCGLGF